MGCASSRQLPPDSCNNGADQIRAKSDSKQQDAGKKAWQSNVQQETQQQSTPMPQEVDYDTFRIGVRQDVDLHTTTTGSTFVENLTDLKIKKLQRLTGGSSISQRSLRLQRRNVTMLDFIPQVPWHFVQPVDYDIIQQQVFSAEFLQSERGICMLDGQGGVGKSTLMMALIRSDRVRKRFPDGIIWVNLTVCRQEDSYTGCINKQSFPLAKHR
eukprot:TRINITY_DN10169_c1_g1_i4.p1 TRINITY_DN10169_c1_g1~~TRINITY_DN10169_c1_g1_i4.p1  ORF type:complete len:213 (-),score=21.58 TRINITY_DN10169_c1_g1_i4:14-652(-)